MATKWILMSHRTRQHPEVVYVACDSEKGGPETAWYMTPNKAEAHDFGQDYQAREFKRELKEDGESCGLIDDGHLWMILNTDG